VLNEFVAYTQLGLLKTGPGALSPRTFSIAPSPLRLCHPRLQSAGRSAASAALVPNRRNDLARLGFRAMLAGTMANLMSAAMSPLRSSRIPVCK